MIELRRLLIVLRHFKAQSINQLRGDVISGREERTTRLLSIKMDERKLSIVVFSLFFSWILSFPFEGQVLYALAQRYNIEPGTMIFGAITVHFAGLILCGLFDKEKGSYAK